MTKILAFGYSKRTGKDTCARFLDSFLRCERPGLKVKKVSFAAKLKDVSYQLYGHCGLQPGVYYETEAGALIKETKLAGINLSPREIWIAVGNKLREVYENTWLDFALMGAKADVILITDLRFPNEGTRIRELGGLCYEVCRPGLAKGHDAAEIALDGWPLWHGTIDNSGTLQDLNAKMEVLGREILNA